MALTKKVTEMTEIELYAELNARDAQRQELAGEMRTLRTEIAFRTNAPGKLAALSGMSDAEIDRLKEHRAKLKPAE